MHLASIGKSFVTATFFIFNVFISFSQPPIQWQRCLGGGGSDICAARETLDGGYVIVGSTNSMDGNVSGNENASTNVWIMKLDVYGVPQWQSCLGGTYNDGDVYNLIPFQETSDGGFLIAAESWSNNGDVTGNHGYGDIWAIKLDFNGNLEWQRCLGGTLLERPTSIRETSDGGCVVTGYTKSNDGDVIGNHGGWSDVWVVKLNSIGNLDWQRCVGGSGEETEGTAYQVADGGYIVSALTDSNDGDAAGNHGWNDILIVKLDGSGNTEWTRCYGSTGNESVLMGGSPGVDDYSASIAIPTSDGGYIFTCTTYMPDGDVDVIHSGGSDMWVVKLDYAGNIEWQRSLGGTSIDEGHKVKQTADGGYLLVGSAESNDGDAVGNNLGYSAIWLVRLNSMGTTEWQRVLGGWRINLVQQTADGGFIVGINRFCGGLGDFTQLVKINENGGYIGNSVFNDWGICLDTETPATMDLHSLQQTSDGGYLVGVGFQSPFYPGFHGSWDILVTKLSPESGAFVQNNSNFSLEPYPNPATDEFYFTVEGNTIGQNYYLFDSTGRKVLDGKITSNQTIFSIKEIPVGIYLLSLENGLSARLVKE
jgi:hypothetical protein